MPLGMYNQYRYPCSNQMKAMQPLPLDYDDEKTNHRYENYWMIKQKNPINLTCSLLWLLVVFRSIISTGDICGYCGKWSVLRILLGSTRQYGGGASITPVAATAASVVSTFSFVVLFRLLFDDGFAS
jgi:hypothetical protein